jgi:hypothetical protein
MMPGSLAFRIIEALTRQIRIVSLKQAKDCWWPDLPNTKRARRKLMQMVERGWIERHLINAHPLLPITQPLFAWRLGMPDPDSESVSQCCHKRWNRPAIATEVFVASPLAASLLGSTARGLPRREQWDHDLLLTSVYVHYRCHRPKLAPAWIGEHSLPKAGYRIKDPDAFLMNSQRRVLCVIESAGRYSPDQVASFHEHCAERDLPYELW